MIIYQKVEELRGRTAVWGNNSFNKKISKRKIRNFTIHFEGGNIYSDKRQSLILGMFSQK